MGPIDYSSLIPQQNYGQDILSGLQVGQAYQQVQAQRAAQQLANAQASQYKMDAQAALANPTPQAFSALALKYPAQREAVKQSWDSLSAADQKAEGDTMSQAYSALLANQPDVAKQVVQTQIDARKNAGLDTSHFTNALTLLNTDPKQAQAALGFTLSHIGDPKTFASQYGALGGEQRAQAEAPADLATKQAGAVKASADATKAGVDATVAQATLPQQIAKPASDLATAEQKRRLDDFDAQIKAADSETKRGELTLARDKYTSEQGLKTQEAGQAVQGQLTSTNNAIDTATKLLNDPLLNSSIGIGSAIGKALSFIPGTDNKDYRSNVETLKAQLFIPAIAEMKAAGGAGALSDAEGKKLSALVASLDSDMSKGAFKNNLGVIIKNLSNVQQRILADKRTPTSGGAFVVNHPTFGAVSEGDINRLMKQYPGATREQVMTYLNQSGGTR